jgi:redox-sensitive bicupin YhaK (pirin superfamily)
LYQDAVFLVAHADDGLSERHYALDNQRLAYIHVATGSATVNGVRLSAGDAVQMSDESSVDVVLSEGAQVLLFDLPVTA